MKTRMLSLYSVILVLFAAVGFVRASCTDLYVQSNGVDAGDCCNPTQPCQTIKFAMDLALDGDTIHVSGRLDVSKATFVNRIVHLVCDDVAHCEINANQLGHNCLYVTSSGSTISHFHLTNATATAIIYDFEGFSYNHVLDDILISHSHAGAGVVGAQLLMRNVRVFANAQGGVTASRSDITVIDSTFDDNRLQFAPSPCGSALSAIISNVSLQNVLFVNHQQLPADEEDEACAVLSILGNSATLSSSASSSADLESSLQGYPTLATLANISFVDNQLPPASFSHTPALWLGASLINNQIAAITPTPNASSSSYSSALLSVDGAQPVTVRGGQFISNQASSLVSVRNGASISLVDAFASTDNAFDSSSWLCRSETATPASGDILVNAVMVTDPSLADLTAVQCQTNCSLTVNQKPLCK